MNKNFTLEDLLMTIDKQASDSEESKKEEKKEESKKSEESSEKKEESKKGEESSEKKEGKDEGQEKSASDAGAALAKEVFEKVASIKTTQKGNEMNKQASVAGKALADAILTKLASAGDMNTSNGVNPGVAVSKIVADNAAMVAQDDSKIQAIPGTDGAGNGGSVNQIFDAIVQDAMSEGATAYNQVNTGGASAGEGKANQQGAMSTAVGVDDSQEKMAAVITLCENGVDFDTAVDMVKEAEQAILIEEDAHVKQAAVGELVAQGFDFETAVELIKEANTATEFGKRVASKGKDLAEKAIAAGKGVAEGAKGTINAIKAEGTGNYAKRYAANAKDHMMAHKGAYAAGAAGVGALGLGAAAMREKKAAFEALVDAGVDFEKAAELVAAKSQEIYGC